MTKILTKEEVKELKLCIDWVEGGNSLLKSHEELRRQRDALLKYAEKVTNTPCVCGYTGCSCGYTFQNDAYVVLGALGL